MTLLKLFPVVLVAVSSVAFAQGPQKTAPWLVAQAEVKGCEMDGQFLRPGAVVCHEGKTWTCNRFGQWDIVNKKCSAAPVATKRK